MLAGLKISEGSDADTSACGQSDLVDIAVDSVGPEVPANHRLHFFGSEVSAGHGLSCISAKLEVIVGFDLLSTWSTFAQHYSKDGRIGFC